MKLYASPGACSIAPLIALHEGALAHEVVWVGLRDKQIHGGGDYRDVNPKGKISVIERDDGTVLTENVAVLLYLAGVAPSGALAPPADGTDRERLTEWLTFIATEIHKQVLWTAFVPAAPDEMKSFVTTQVAPVVLSHPEAALTASEYLTGDTFSVADAYLFWALTLLPHAGVDLAPFPALRAFRDRMAARPAVAAALAFENKGRRLMAA